MLDGVLLMGDLRRKPRAIKILIHFKSNAHSKPQRGTPKQNTIPEHV